MPEDLENNGSSSLSAVEQDRAAGDLSAARAAGQHQKNADGGNPGPKPQGVPVQNKNNADGEINKLEQIARPLQKDVQKISGRLNTANRGAFLTDFLIALGKYLALIAGVWTAIIIILLSPAVIPFLFLIYYTGLKKGTATKTLKKLLEPQRKKLAEKRSQLEKIKNRLRELYREKFSQENS